MNLKPPSENYHADKLAALASKLHFHRLEAAIVGRAMENALEKFPASLPGTTEQNKKLAATLKSQFFEVIGQSDLANYIWNLPRPDFNRLVADSPD